MDKIGIITYHNNENRGAILQAYALQRALSDVFAADVEIVEYRTQAKERERRNSVFLSKRPWRFRRRLRDRRVVEGFVSGSLSTSSDSIVTDDHETAVRWLEDQEYDVVVTGSDEVWKVGSGGISGALSWLFPSRPFPNLYFLDPALSATKVAYAASANRTDLESLTQFERETMGTYLAEYDSIGVRDAHTQDILNELGIDGVERVPDPTLLVDLPHGDGEAILRERGVDPDRPILGFHGPENPVFEEVCSRYRDAGYRIVTPTTSEYADVELVGELDPFDYYSLYDCFDMVVTSSLHSTIFSLKHHVPFVTVDVNPAYRGKESKTQSLLKDLSLSERHVSAIDGDLSPFYDRVEELEAELDDEAIEDRIATLRERGMEYLRTVRREHEARN